MVGVGTGALMGVARLSLGGRVGVGTLYLPCPPCPLQESMPRQERPEPGAERWGRWRGRSGHRRASFYPPFPWHDPEENGAGGRGAEGG